jgi:hypothetical protein
MNKTISSITIALLIGCIIGLLMAGGGAQVSGQSHGNSQSLRNHHQESKFSLAPGESHVVRFPMKDCPIIFSISSSNNILASGAVFIDPETGNLSENSGEFYMTRSDTQSFINESPVPGEHLVITNTTSDVTINYCVSMWF